MSKGKNQPIENAEEIIELFGGIRPMAKKIDVAVTTVQGWKKRNKIPGSRRTQILEAAQEHQVDLTSVLSGDAAAKAVNAAGNNNEKVEVAAPQQEKTQKPLEKNKGDESDKGAAEDGVDDDTGHDGEEDEALTLTAKSIDEQPDTSDVTEDVSASDFIAEAKPDPQPEELPPSLKAGLQASETSKIEDAVLDQKLNQTKVKAVTISTWVSIIIGLLVASAVIVLLWPQTQNNQQQLNTLQKDVGAVRSDVEGLKAQPKSFLGNIIPEDLEARISNLQDQAQNAQVVIGQAMEKAEQISNDVLADDGSDLNERITRLEGHISEVTGNTSLLGLWSNVDNMVSDVAGQEQLRSALDQLNALTSSVQDGEQLNSVLDQARNQSDALGQTFQDVPAQDLKAAAMLLAMMQMRSSLNRDEAAFQDDLDLLMNLAGEENVELQAALDKLAPHAEAGVLTPEGLSQEFRTLAGDAVVASLKGEEVSLGDRARARMNELLKIEKDGELLTGTPTQASLNRIENLLEQGQVDQAVREMETLDGDAADVLAPFLDKAKATALSQDVEKLLSKQMSVAAFGRKVVKTGQSVMNDMSGQRVLVQDKELGINILTTSNPLDKLQQNKIPAIQ